MVWAGSVGAGLLLVAARRPVRRRAAVGSIGFGVLASFAALFDQARHWSNPALMLSMFGVCSIVSRIAFASRIGLADGLRVALACFAVESTGPAVIREFSPLGAEAISRVSPANRGAALGAYSLFSDVGARCVGAACRCHCRSLRLRLGVPVRLLSSLSAFLLAEKAGDKCRSSRQGHGPERRPRRRRGLP